MFGICKLNVKSSRYTPGVAQRVGRGIALLFHDHSTRRGWVVSSTPRPHFTPGKDPVPILQEALWAPGPVWTGGKSRPYRDSIPDRPARSQSLYRLSYPADICKVLSVFCYISHSFLVLNFLPNRCRCKGLLLHLIGLNDTHTQTHTNIHSVGLLWTRDQPVADTCA